MNLEGMADEQLKKNRDSLLKHAPWDMLQDKGQAAAMSRKFDDVVLNDVEDMPGQMDVAFTHYKDQVQFTVWAPAFSVDAAYLLMKTCGCC